MPARTMTFETLLNSLRSNKLAPIYLLHGEEGYFIDALLAQVDTLLDEQDKPFNQSVFYAPSASPMGVIQACRAIPMMAPFTLVIIKECQAVNANTLDKLVPYIQHPSPQTVFVMASRGAAVKGKLLAAVKKCDQAVIFDSRKVTDRELPGYITDFINRRGLNIQPKALEMMREYVGTDLSHLYNQLDKLASILGRGATVTPEAIERHVGYSKSFNAFELVDALAARDAARAYRIADYFAANPKAVPLVMATASIFAYFSDLLVTYFVKDKSEHGLMQALGIKWPSMLKRFNTGRSNYNAYQVIEIIRAIRTFDTRSKGIDSRQNEHSLFRDMIFHILTAPGNLFFRD